MVIYQDNKYVSLTELAKKHGISYQVLYVRIKSGWNLEKALETPVKVISKGVKYQSNDYVSLKELAKIYGIKYQTFYRRLYRGWSLEDAVSVPVKHAKSASLQNEEQDRCEPRGPVLTI